MRVCLTSTIKNEVIRRKDGSSFISSLVGSEAYNGFIRIFDQTFSKNNTYHSTTETEECIARLISNESDISTAILSMDENVKDYKVPVPIRASKVSFLTGYDLKRKPVKVKDLVNVFSNFNLLQPSVYFCSLLIIFLLMLLISARMWMFFNQRGQKKKRIHWRAIRRELMAVYFGNSQKFKWITLLFVILTFYLVNSFKILYKTSQIILEEPKVIKSYRQLLEEEQVLPTFYEPLTKVSMRFRNAPKNSWRGRIWSKLLAHSRGDISNYFLTGSTLHRNPVKFLREQFELMHNEQIVIFGLKMTSTLMMTTFSSVSPDDQLWRIFIFSDQSEHEDRLGFQLSHFFPDENYFIRRLRRLTESYIIEYFSFLVADGRHYFEKLASTSKSHRREQSLVIDGLYSFGSDIQVDVVGLQYFGCFINFLLVLIMVARIVLSYEILLQAKRPLRSVTDQIRLFH